MQLGGEVDSPSPVMTFFAGGVWLAVRVAQMDRISIAQRLWPVPLASAQYVGLMDDNGELVPVLRLPLQQQSSQTELVAILHVRGESVGLAVESTGRVYDSYRLQSTGQTPPLEGAQLASALDEHFWLIDPDQLWQQPGDNVTTPSH